MTGPAPDAKPPAGPDGGNPPADDKGKKGPAPKPVELLSVVQFTRTNPVTRREHRGVGVVVDVDDAGVTVAPVQHGHTLRLAADEVAVVTGEV